MRGEFEQKFSKNSNARGLPGGDVEASISLVHKAGYRSAGKRNCQLRVFVLPALNTVR